MIARAPAVGDDAVASTNALFAPRRASLLRLVASRQTVGEEAERSLDTPSTL
jgi:hypothetical protein